MFLSILLHSYLLWVGSFEVICTPLSQTEKKVSPLHIVIYIYGRV